MRSLKQAIHLDRVIDVSGPAEAEGYLVPVAISRRLWEAAVLVWSPCACSDCEESAKNATTDRIQRLLRNLRDAVEQAGDETEIEFALDTPGKKKTDKRTVWTLRAILGPQDAEHPVITITLHNEQYITPLTSFRPAPPEANA